MCPKVALNAGLVSEVHGALQSLAFHRQMHNSHLRMIVWPRARLEQFRDVKYAIV